MTERTVTDRAARAWELVHSLPVQQANTYFAEAALSAALEVESEADALALVRRARTCLDAVDGVECPDTARQLRQARAVCNTEEVTA